MRVVCGIPLVLVCQLVCVSRAHVDIIPRSCMVCPSAQVSRVSQGRASSELGGSPQQEFEMKVKGLECLVLVLRCMREWCGELDDGSSTPTSGDVAAVTAAGAWAADISNPACQCLLQLTFLHSTQKSIEKAAVPCESTAPCPFEQSH